MLNTPNVFTVRALRQTMGVRSRLRPKIDVRVGLVPEFV